MHVQERQRVQAVSHQHASLIDVDDSILIVIDVQDGFLARFSAQERERLVNRIGWLISVATKIGVPLVVTAEEIPKHGGVTPALAQRLPPGIRVFDKRSFGVAGDPEIVSAVRDTGRHTTVLVGLETDVCVAQSAIGLLQLGYRVVVVADATGSPGTGHEAGLERVRGAGILASSVKSIYYEWMRTVDKAVEFWEKHGPEIGLPEGVEL
jgi:nicotinamidase-related amidase